MPRKRDGWLWILHLMPQVDCSYSRYSQAYMSYYIERSTDIPFGFIMTLTYIHTHIQQVPIPGSRNQPTIKTVVISVSDCEVVYLGTRTTLLHGRESLTLYAIKLLGPLHRAHTIGECLPLYLSLKGFSCHCPRTYTEPTLHFAVSTHFYICSLGEDGGDKALVWDVEGSFVASYLSCDDWWRRT